MKVATDISIEVICTACEHGPCVIGHLAKQETVPNKFTVPAEIAETLHENCKLPEEE